MTQISSNAASQRENARQTDGKFGHQHHSEADLSLIGTASEPDAIHHIGVSQFGGKLTSAWLSQHGDAHHLHAIIKQDHQAMIPKEYAAAHRHTAEQMQAYLHQRKHVVEPIMGDWFSTAEVTEVSLGDTSVGYEVVDKYDALIDPNDTRYLLDEEFGLHDEDFFDDMNDDIAAELAQYDTKKLPNPEVLNESNQRQFADRVIEALHRDAQDAFDDEGAHDAKVHLAGDDELRLRAALHNVYAENAGDIEAFDESTGRNPASEAYYVAAGYAEDLESTVKDLNARVVGRRLERSFIAEMPKLDTTHGRLEIEDDGTIHIHPQVFEDFAAKREQRIRQDSGE